VRKATPTLGSLYIPYAGGFVIHRCTKFHSDRSISSKVFNGIWSRPWPRPPRGHFMICSQGGYVLYVCTRFQGDSSFPSKVIRMFQNCEIGSRVPGHAHFGVALYSVRWRGPSSVGVPCLTWIAQFIQKLWTGSQNSEIRSRDPGHAHLVVVLWSVRREAPSSISLPDFKHRALFLQKILGGPRIWKLGHVHKATHTLGSLYIPYAGGVQPASVYQFWLGSLNSFKSNAGRLRPLLLYQISRR